MHELDFSGIKVCLAVTANHDKIEKDFMMNLLQLYRPFDWIVSLKGAHIKSASLNEHLAEASNRDCTHVFFMDVDMHFPSPALVKLLSHRLPIVSGLYHLKDYPYSPIAGWTDAEGIAVNGNGKMWKYDYCPLPVNSLVDVHWCGIGCLLVDMDVFNKIWFPPFHDKWNMELGKRQKGHDVIFCEEVRAAGYKVYVDTSVDCTHIGRSMTNKIWIDAYYKARMQDALDQVALEHSLEPGYWDETWFANRAMNKERRQDVLIEELAPRIPEGASVIDVGCGDGHLLRALKALRKCDVYGMDFSRQAIAALADKGVPGEVADIRTYSANGRRAHTVVLSHVLEHVKDEDMHRVLSLISDLATDQAFIIVPQEKEKWYEHVRTYDEPKLLAHVAPYFDSVEITKIKGSDAVMERNFDYRHIIAHCSKQPSGSDEVKAA